MRLASFDIVTAVAVIGAIDAVEGQDTVLPPLDLSQSIPKIAVTDLTDLDLAELMSIAVAPATRHADLPGIDLGEMDLEQLLALEADATGEAAIGLNRVTMEELMRVEVGADGQDEFALPFDLIGLDPEFLQDIEFGIDRNSLLAPYRQVAALDLASILDEPGAGEFGQYVRIAAPMTTATSDYASAQSESFGLRIAGGDAMMVAAPTVGTDQSSPGSQPSGPGSPSISPGSPSTGPVNRPPAALNDTLETTQGTALVGNVLVNDSDPDGDALSVTSTGTIDTAQFGSAQLTADGSFTYAPRGDFYGIDSFQYSVMDVHENAATATVSIDVTRSNLAPVAQDDRFVSTIGVAIEGNLLANDYDPDGDKVTVSNDGLLATDKGGVILLNIEGTFEYRPPDGFFGTDSFSYNVTDGNGGESVATSTFEVVKPRNILNGGAGDDFLQGSSEDDMIRGYAGDDLLIGGAGDDILDGGLGIDVLLGGAGNDVFEIGPGTGGDLDAIADFKSTVDIIDLSAFGISALSDLSIEGDGLGGSLIMLPGGDSLALLLVDPASLSPSDFIY